MSCQAEVRDKEEKEEAREGDFLRAKFKSPPLDVVARDWLQRPGLAWQLPILSRHPERRDPKSSKRSKIIHTWRTELSSARQDDISTGAAAVNATM